MTSQMCNYQGKAMVPNWSGMACELWDEISSHLPKRIDVKNLSVANRHIRFSCQNTLWHAVDLRVSYSNPTSRFDPGLKKLGTLLKCLASNPPIGAKVRHLTLPLQYSTISTRRHQVQAMDIVRQLPGLIHLVVVPTFNAVSSQDRSSRNLEALLWVERKLNDYPIHCLEGGSFWTSTMVACFPASIRIFEGMFSDCDISLAFLAIQRNTLRIWKQNELRDKPYFFDEGVDAPSLSSLRLTGTEEKWFKKIKDSLVLQSSLRAIQIGHLIDPYAVFPAMRSFAVLESLAIMVPVHRASEFLEKMANDLPQLRRLWLGSNRFLTYDLIPSLEHLERLVMWMVQVNTNVIMSFIGDTNTSRYHYFGEFAQLHERCPQLTHVDIPDFTLWGLPIGRVSTKWGAGRRVRVTEGHVEEIVGLPPSMELENAWII